MKKKDFLKLFQEFEFKGIGEPKMNVFRDWKIIILSFFILMLLVCFWDGYLYWKYERGLTGSVSVKEEKFTTIDYAGLKTVLGEMEKRREISSQSLQNMGLKIQDPALWTTKETNGVSVDGR